MVIFSDSLLSKGISFNNDQEAGFPGIKAAAKVKPITPRNGPEEVHSAEARFFEAIIIPKLVRFAPPRHF
jgi:hypothetical protein